MSMKWKIILPMTAILAALVIITTVSSTLRFAGYTGILLNERIAVAANGLKKFISDRERDTRIAAVTAAENIDIVKAVDEHNTKEIIRLLTDSLDLYHVDFFVVTDDEGTVIARTFSPHTHSDSILDQINIREALKGNTYTCIEQGAYVKVSARTGAPVYNSGGILIGVISAGVRFDTNDTLDLLKEHYNADFTVFYEKARIATTITVNGERIVGREIDPNVAEYLYSSKKEDFVSVDVLDQNYSAYYLPLLDDHNETFAIIAAACSNTKLISEKNALQRSVMLIGLSGLILSIAMLLFITSRIVKPVNRLAYLVSEVTNGNMNVNIDKTNVAKDEIGLLTSDIYSLVDVIKLILSDLSYLTVDLNKFGAIDFQIDTAKYSGSYKEIIDGIKKLADSISTMRKTMAVMDHLDSMISVVDFDYNLLYVNRNMADTYKMDRKNSAGKKCYAAIRNLDHPCPVCQLAKLLPDKDTYPFVNYDNLLDETSGIYIGGRAAIIRWVDGAQVFFNSVKDETIKIKYQEQMREAMMAAEAASVAKSAFLANMSHEIRTPMNSIIGFSELALDSDISPATGEYLSMIEENAKWLLQIINDILDISKVESGNIKLEHIPFDLRDLLNSCKTVIMPKANEKNISLQFYAESATGKHLVGDPTRLRQVLLNLLSNAVKFTDSGSVKLSVSAKDETKNRITLRFEIKDSGIGMTAEQVGKIFEPFMQGDISTTRKYGGTGLGMAITKNILDLMGSRKLNIESEPGAGTAIGFELNFDITDPLSKEEKTPEISKTVKELERPDLRGEVLVCEDNVVNQRVITEHLSRVGLQFEIAENGQEGINKVRSRMDKGEKPFDLILMDIHMPVMDGLEATPKIMEMGTGTPIVAMTANIMADDRELYKKAGMMDYLGKPFTSQELWRCLLKFFKPAVSPGAPNPRPVASAKENGDTELQKELKTYFVKSNQTKFDEIENAIAAADIKSAHRMAHTLKSNAALIGMTALREAAAEVEAALKDSKNRATETQMNVLKNELSAALAELSRHLAETEDGLYPGDASVGFDAGKARELMEELETLLESGNPECLKMTAALKAIPGSAELIRQIEDFNFGAAAEILWKLKDKLA